MSGWNRLLIVSSAVTAFMGLISGWSMASDSGLEAKYAIGGALGGILLVALPAWGFIRGLFWIFQGFRPK